MRALLIGVVLTMWLAVPASAVADKVAVIAVEIGGDGAPELQPQLARSVADGVASAGHEVIGLEELVATMKPTPELIGCNSTTCLQRIGEVTAATSFIWATVEVRGADYTVELQLFDAKDGMVRQLSKGCSVCTITEVNNLISEAANDLFTTAAPVPVLIVVRPQGATLIIDGKPAGIAPYSGTLTRGSHSVVVTSDGYAGTEQEIEVTGGQQAQRFEINLKPIEAVVPSDSPVVTERPLETWKWVTAGAGAFALVTGITLLAIDGNGTCDGAGECEKIYDTKDSGIVGISGGLALGAASAWMFYRDSQDQRSASVSLTPTDGGLYGSASWRF